MHEYSDGCPFCGGTSEGGFVTIESSQAWQTVTCTRCHREWLEVYGFAFYADPHSGEKLPGKMPTDEAITAIA